MGKISFGKVLDCLTFSITSMKKHGNDDSKLEKKPLIGGEVGHLVRLKEALAQPKTLAFQLKPKMVMLKVAIHCNGCAKKVEKHISKMEGVTSYEVDVDTKMVVVIGDIVPLEVLQSISKVKNAEMWTLP